MSDPPDSRQLHPLPGHVADELGNLLSDLDRDQLIVVWFAIFDMLELHYGGAPSGYYSRQP